ncbi:MAG TPA: WG repeat-containing protein, partial [Blastocatellia bacterium]|nr:WG repeat-containing protein [Blastocatellia bacterium]
IPPKFVLSDDFHDGMARVVTEGPCTYIFEGPCADREVLPENAPHSGQYPPCKCAFIDRTGRLLTTMRYDSAKEFSEGLAPVQVGNKWGYIDKKGQIVIEPKFDKANLFSEGFALVQQGRLAGFIDRTGSFVIPAQFEYAEDFSDGLAVVGFSIISHKENKGHIDRAFWYINKQGKQAIPEAFDLASSFFKGLAHVRLKLHKKDENGESSEPGPFAYINTTGETVFTY